ncbi:hypothetical protein GCM10009552_29140 [Rothia nasimurium]|uniref:Relaxation protein n=1 Tax=Luteibacter anthropi TaxID=564369 RepID=A0A7X5UAP4_9GAMM|nr:hypothetical protein [Luteibacter anthropi]NII06895.1 hypothetical protein [Luteibacter anthropi]
MDANLSPLIETAKQLALLAETLERRSAAASSHSEQTTQALSRTLAGIKADVDRIVHGASTHVTQSARQGVDAALHEGAGKFDQAAAQAGSKMQGVTQRLDEAVVRAAASLERQAKLAYLAVMGAMVLLVAGGGAVLWMEWQAYGDARARTAAANVDAETATAYAEVHMTSCGGHPCIKLDAKSPRWGDKGQYVLVDTKPAGK